ncbi:hypothetical protein LR48_Vigan10g011100 [Vigna angularis]|uniref:Bet v I/Major latex protein domain-containing protein n=1 Tax=Phaseolus angularis TaxID=3914 RepID=A0A0L9VHP0_PHAAN|nr:hypothetical protein LR48_Vigan10g011100 [Vigna angularis]
MGNSLGVVLDNYIGSATFPCHLQLEPFTSIYLSRNLNSKKEEWLVEDMWEVTYTVDEKTSIVHLKRLHLYGSGGRWGLLAVESKRNKTEEDAEVVTVAHYIVKSSETSFYRSTGTNIGLSVTANFRASNGEFEITAEGPEQHPAFALLYMFDEVKRTGNWKPTMCPHCDHKLEGLFYIESMAVFTFEDETTSPVAPATLYKALVKDADNIVPKAVDSFKSVEIVEGNGGPGTIKKISFLEDGETKFVLHKIEGIDEAKLGYVFTCHYHVLPREMQEGSPMVEGSVGMVMVISLKTML